MRFTDCLIFQMQKLTDLVFAIFRSVRPLNPLSTADYSIWEASRNQLKLADGAGRRGAKEDWTFGECRLLRLWPLSKLDAR